jgi:hypothetical protein
MGSGIGNGTVNGGVHGDEACIVAQAAIIDALAHGRKIGEPTDKLDCACPLLRRMAILLNDTRWWASDLERATILTPLIPLLLDSDAGNKILRRRLFRYLDCHVRELFPMLLEKRWPKDAIALKALTPIADSATADKAIGVLQNLDRALDRGHALALALALDRGLDLARALDRGLDLDLALRAKYIDLFKELASIE